MSDPSNPDFTDGTDPPERRLVADEVEAAQPAIAPPIAGGRSTDPLYVLTYADALLLAGPFSCMDDAHDWGRGWQAEHGDDPRWHTIHLAGEPTLHRANNLALSRGLAGAVPRPEDPAGIIATETAEGGRVIWTRGSREQLAGLCRALLDHIGLAADFAAWTDGEPTAEDGA